MESAGEEGGAEEPAGGQSVSETDPESITGTIQYAMWGDELERQHNEEFCASFSEKYPNATVEFVHIPSDYYLKLQTLAAAGDLPDTFNVTSQNIARMAPACMTLDDFQAQYPDLVATVPEAVLQSGYYDGKLYCLTNAIDPYNMAINKDIFAEMGVDIPEDGWTMDDLEALLPQLTKVDEASGRTQYYALAVTVYNCDYFCFIGNYGGTFMKDGKLCWSTDQGVIDAVENGEKGQCYLLTGHYMAVRDMLNIVSDISGKKKIKVMLPMWLAKLTAPLAELWYKMRRQPPLFTRYSLYTLGVNSNFDNSKARLRLGFNPRPLKDTLKDTIAWLKNHNRLKTFGKKKLRKKVSDKM